MPIKQLDKYLKEIIELVCIRIRHKKSTALCCNFVVSLSILVIRHGLPVLHKACEQVQPGILAT